MKKVQSVTLKVYTSNDCQISKFYLLFNGNDYALLHNTYVGEYYWICLHRNSQLYGKGVGSLQAFIENSHRYGDIYEFDTMQELLEYYLEQIKKK